MRGTVLHAGCVCPCVMKVLRGGHRVLIFNLMTKVVDLQTRLTLYRHIPFLRLDVSKSPKKRKKMVLEWNSPESDVKIVLLMTRAGGLAANLQEADSVIVLDRYWNPSLDQQTQDSAKRIG